MASVRYEDRHRKLAEYSRQYDEAFQARDWQTVEGWPTERDPNKLDDLRERTDPIVLEVIAAARDLESSVSCALSPDELTAVAEDQMTIDVVRLREKLARLDEEANK